MDQQTLSASREEILQTLLEEITRVFKCIAVSYQYGKNPQKLSRPQIAIMMVLAKKEGMAVKDLAEKFNVTSGAITQLTNSLVEKGLIQREEDPEDRRILKIGLCKSAENTFKDFRRTYFKSLTPMFDSLNTREIKQLILLLSKLSPSSNIKGYEI